MIEQYNKWDFTSETYNDSFVKDRECVSQVITETATNETQQQNTLISLRSNKMDMVRSWECVSDQNS